MKAVWRLAAVVVMIAACSDEASAQTVTSRRNLAFGSISGDHDLAGTVTIAATGAKSTTGGAFNQGGTASSAQFRVSGTANRTVAITLPTSFNMTVSGKTFTVTNLTHDCSNPCTIASTGRIDINVGGVATLSANQGAGSYTGSFSFTAIYN
jgi:hypothetical protein